MLYIEMSRVGNFSLSAPQYRPCSGTVEQIGGLGLITYLCVDIDVVVDTPSAYTPTNQSMKPLKASQSNKQTVNMSRSFPTKIHTNKHSNVLFIR